MYARDGVTIDRRLMAQWMGRVRFELKILAAHVLDQVLQGPRVFADETSLPTLRIRHWRGEEDLALGLMPAMTAPSMAAGHPMLAYRFADSRSGECFRRHLGGFCGIFQLDGHAACNQLVCKDGAMTARASLDRGP